jgi:hypothetical protein
MTQNLEKLKISKDSKSRMTQNLKKLVKGVLNIKSSMNSKTSIFWKENLFVNP